MIIDISYSFGDIVYLKTDKDQNKRLICELKVNPGQVIYALMHGTQMSWHYEFEFTTEQNLVETIL